MFSNGSMMLKFVLFLVVVLGVTVQSKDVNFKVCGQELTDTIKRYCSGRYNARVSMDKRMSNERG